VIRAVLFDFYDTLAHVDSAIVTAARERLAEQAGVEPSLLHVAWRDSAERRMLGQMGGLETEIVALLEGLGADAPMDLVQELASIERRAWHDAVRLYPDALATLRELRTMGYRLGVLSNCSVQAGMAIEDSPVAKLTDALVLSFRLGLAKPAPAIYRQACEVLRVAPAEAVFVADGAFGELDGAAAVGMTTVRIEQANQSGTFGFSTHWDYQVGRLAEVPPLLRRLGHEPRGTRDGANGV
jgi:putative hydrolase of the HAD superfamily